MTQMPTPPTFCSGCAIVRTCKEQIRRKDNDGCDAKVLPFVKLSVSSRPRETPIVAMERARDQIYRMQKDEQNAREGAMI